MSLSLSLLSKKDSNEDGSVFAVMGSIYSLGAPNRGPLDICCVVDISGSMNTSASIDGGEDAGLSVLGKYVLTLILFFHSFSLFRYCQACCQDHHALSSADGPFKPSILFNYC
jgi:hypothetical protein